MFMYHPALAATAAILEIGLYNNYKAADRVEHEAKWPV